MNAMLDRLRGTATGYNKARTEVGKMVGEMQEEHEQSQTQGETVGEKTELTIERTGREHTVKQETEDTSFLSAVSMPIVAITALARPNQAL